MYKVDVCVGVCVGVFMCMYLTISKLAYYLLCLKVITSQYAHTHSVPRVYICVCAVVCVQATQLNCVNTLQGIERWQRNTNKTKIELSFKASYVNANINLYETEEVTNILPAVGFRCGYITETHRRVPTTPNSSHGPLRVERTKTRPDTSRPIRTSHTSGPIRTSQSEHANHNKLIKNVKKRWKPAISAAITLKCENTFDTRSQRHLQSKSEDMLRSSQGRDQQTYAHTHTHGEYRQTEHSF
jgi:hypothetical protein